MHRNLQHVLGFFAGYDVDRFMPLYRSGELVLESFDDDEIVLRSRHFQPPAMDSTPPGVREAQRYYRASFAPEANTLISNRCR